MKHSIFAAVGLFCLSSVALADSQNSDVFSIKGDLRYRHESRQVEGSPYRPSSSIRGRLNLNAKVNDKTMAKFRFISGTGKPFSANQPLDDSFSKKPFYISHAYIAWNFLAGANLNLGKAPLALYKPGKSDLVWDHDISAEGLALKYEMGDTWKPFASVFTYSLEEESGGADSHLAGGQLGLNFDSGDHNFNIVAGGYSFLGAKGRKAYYQGTSNGNSVDGSSQYLNGYDLLDAGLDYTLTTGFGPIGFNAHFVSNSGADTENTGYLVGVSYGSAKKVGGVSVYANYRKLEKDAIVGAFTDGDHAGGVADSQGTKINVTYKLAENTSFAISHFLDEINVASGAPTKFEKTMFDFWVNF